MTSMTPNTTPATNSTLLLPEEPCAYRIEREDGQSPFLLICDHAGNRIPHRLNSLGVATADLQRHIAWDIGAADVASKLATLLDAFAIFQTYSRLVIDCNRPTESTSSIAPISEHTLIPGNELLSSAQRTARQREIFWPYHHRIVTELDARLSTHRPTILVSIHSFTPKFKAHTRAMHAGVLYNRDQRLAHRVLPLLREDLSLIVGDNEPYAVSDLTDYAIPEYGEKRGLLHVEMEIRQDLIADDAGQTHWAKCLAVVLHKAIDSL
jgi:predicted N-formylglutamate amidohydrolase